ncbi:hypothetical protein UWO_23608 [Escherichia coli O32:H37 str. P4]|nr:hypothetical protein UWO_23608 [Escherichia coli O32:H37 str. P4]
MFPAPAGINRQPFSIAGVSKSVPRASGDKPLQTVANAINKKCSPRQRG